MATIEFDPNTGKKLSKGQVVFDANNNKYVQQGTEFGTYVAPTVQYDNATGKKLKAGETTIQDGKVLKQGDLYTGANAYGAKSDIVNYSSEAGTMLKPGETTTYGGQTVTQGQKLPAATAPTNAAMVSSGMPSVNMPTTTPSQGNISNAMATSSGLASFYDTQAQQDKANADAYQKLIEQQQNSPEAKASNSFLKKLLGSDSPAEVREDAFKETGINPANYFAEEKKRIAEIDSLTQQYNSLKAQKETAIAKASDKMASNSFINNQVAQIERNAAPALNELSANINAKAAIMEAEQGRFAEAQKFVNQAVEDSVSEQKYNMDMFSTFYQLNESAINRLDKQYQSALQSSKDNSEKAYQVAYQEKTQIGEMLMNYPNSGIDIYSDSLQTAMQKVAKAGGSLQAQQETRLQNKVTNPIPPTPGVKLTNANIKTGATNLGMDTGSYQKLDPTVQTWGYSSGGKNFGLDLQDLKAGKSKVSDIQSEINNSIQPQAVKDYMQQQLNAIQGSSTPKSGGIGNFLIDTVGGAINKGASSVWNGIKSLF